jgi:hypothetical protein
MLTLMLTLTLTLTQTGEWTDGIGAVLIRHTSQPNTPSP